MNQEPHTTWYPLTFWVGVAEFLTYAAVLVLAYVTLVIL